MDYEKKYNEAFEAAKKELGVDRKEWKVVQQVLRNIFPQLRESEDERIRKAIIELLKEIEEDETYTGRQHIPNMLSYLEKQKEQPMELLEPDKNVEKIIEDVIRVYGKTQGEWVSGYDIDTLIVNLRRAFGQKEQKPNYCHYGGDPNAERCRWCSAACSARLTEEQKPASISCDQENDTEWSEEDEKFFATALWHISYSASNGKSVDWQCDTTEWLKGVKERLKSLRPQPKQEWSKEDKDNLNNIIWLCENCEKGIENVWIPSQATQIKNLIKSLRPVKQEWSEDDKNMWTHLNGYLNGFSCSENAIKQMADWFYELPNRFNLQPKQEWSEEDERIMNGIQLVLESWDRSHVSSAGLPSLVPKYISWLKSLRPSWKPSEEQMMNWAVEGEIAKDNRGNNVLRVGLLNNGFEIGDKIRVIIINQDEK